MPWCPGGADCAHCGDQIDVRMTGPMPTYCSGACRQAAYRERNALVGVRRRRRTRTTDARRRRNP